MDSRVFEEAVRLRRKGMTYNDIGEKLGYTATTIRKYFVREYKKGRLLELSGYRAARPEDEYNTTYPNYKVRKRGEIVVGGSIVQRLTPEQREQVFDLIKDRGHRSLNDLLMELLLSHLDPTDTPE